ncbi:GmrSD restriction endonuclease domain-containing protein [Gordonia sp. NPDC003424]
MTKSAPPTPPGWHPDPSGSDRLRWWDGSEWTEHYHASNTPESSPNPKRRNGTSAWKIGGGIAAAVAALVVIATVAAPDDAETPSPAAATTTASSGPSSSMTGSSATESPTTTTSVPAAASTPLDVAATAALTKLDTLAVKGRAPKTGYDRARFGQAWSDDVTVQGGHNGCDTRNDLLKSLSDVVIKPGTHGCVVLSGTLHDPYTGRTIAFTRGESTSNAVQIDHVVALLDAWQKGAQQLSADERRDLANDPRNLQPTDGPTNAQKGAGDAATWLPPNKSYRCTYVSRQIDVKAAYRLWVTAAEKSAMQRVLTSCGGTIAAATTTTPTTTEAAAVPPPAPDTPTTQHYVAPPPTTPDSGAYYKNCSAARAAGAAPLYRGQPGYSSRLDRDNDGVACES